ncbi:unnamed protein product [Parascedosporium putredinis]|uniref:Heme oxygenase-like protein n=1 Tax=Parascedosporium putredinis TaxID=1442378 RepID=A0A9P1M8B8_9PEZI|nr:unnamed protein product [Parascedosporium putredinis]CAI7992330.1 unnamed protein product [Parascedosporium putredinis]
MAPHTFTEELLATDPDAFRRATQCEFLRAAALGKMSKQVLGSWLANDRLYIHSYIKAIGRLLTILEVPQTVPETAAQAAAERDPASIRLLDWIVAAMVNIRREEKFFVDVAQRFGIQVNLPTRADGTVDDAEKLDGLCQYEALFGSLEAGPGDRLPWLEGAVLFYATEKCYLEAWSWSKAQLVEQAPEQDADGGALRTEFIDNWTCAEFVQFVKDLGSIVDQGIEEQVAAHGEGVRSELLERGAKAWATVLAAEEKFWPEMPESS